MSPVILHSIEETKAWRGSQTGTVGFVPTMGALHEGHAKLLRKLRPNCDKLVLSIFVNPTQFGPKEDLSKYPRTWESDLAIARHEGVDAVFAPTPEIMYPAGYSTYVEEERLTQPLCGQFRPGHFRGVTTIVLKLFNTVRPQIAYFGLKDAQQFFVLHKMGRDLNLDVSIEGVATVREKDGLALSSRNVYLSTEERKTAPLIHEVLTSIVTQARNAQSLPSLLENGRNRLTDAGFRVQYLDALRLPNLELTTDLSGQETVPHLVAVAAYLGTTRLIDNLILNPEALKASGIRVHLES